MTTPVERRTKFVPISDPEHGNCVCPCGGHITSQGSTDIRVTSHNIGGYVEIPTSPIVYYCEMCQQAFLLILDN